ncbi:MAG: DUF3048 domain-containing protein [Roseburia sp.]
MKKFLAVLCLSTMLAAVFTGCGKKDDTTDNSTEAVTELETETDEDRQTNSEGMMRSYLTGQWVSSDLAQQRPIAIMIGNTNDALPQYGLSQADILYEVPVEGGITRLMGIFEDYSNLDKIGSVRSCRHYFAYYAMEFDAIYVHYGQAIYATELLESDQIDNLNGIDGTIDSLTFYRDPERKQPHNAFVSTQGIQAGIEHQGYETTYDEEYTGHYLFNEDDENEIQLSDGEDAAVVQPGYYISNTWFEYNEEEGVYYRFEFKKPHTDEMNGEQLKFKNILIQYADSKVLDENRGYLDVTTVGSGTGKYITNGKSIDITWKRDSENDITRYYDEDGKEITLNQGKTNVCVVLNSMKDRLNIYANADDFEAPTPSK